MNELEREENRFQCTLHCFSFLSHRERQTHPSVQEFIQSLLALVPSWQKETPASALGGVHFLSYARADIDARRAVC